MKASLNAWTRIDAWPSGALFLCLGLACFVMAVALTLFILSQRGRTRAMTQEEVTDQLMRRTTAEQVSYATSTGRGVRREASMGIDDLRLMAKRGEWPLFWACTLWGPTFALGMLLVSMAAAVWAQDALLAVVTSLGTLPFFLLWPFMGWAALYTKIDAGTADPVPEQRDTEHHAAPSDRTTD